MLNDTRLCSGTPLRAEVREGAVLVMKASAGTAGCGTQLVEREYLGEDNQRGTVLYCPSCDLPDPANVLPESWGASC
jgi:hypothetical protein